MFCLPSDMWKDFDIEYDLDGVPKYHEYTPKGVQKEKTHSEIQIVKGTIEETDYIQQMTNTWLSAGYKIKDIRYIEGHKPLETIMLVILIRDTTETVVGELKRNPYYKGE